MSLKWTLIVFWIKMNLIKMYNGQQIMKMYRIIIFSDVYIYYETNL